MGSETLIFGNKKNTNEIQPLLLWPSNAVMSGKHLFGTSLSCTHPHTHHVLSRCPIQHEAEAHGNCELWNQKHLHNLRKVFNFSELSFTVQGANPLRLHRKGLQ